MKKVDEKKLKKARKEEIEKMKKGVSEFKTFISRGNVVDMAVGVIVGAAFGKIVTSLVTDVITPLIGIFLGGVDFTSLSFKIGDAVITYGNFIQSIIDFLIISVCIFVMIKFFEKFKKKEVKEEPKSDKKPDDIVLLEEIRDLLQKKVK